MNWRLPHYKAKYRIQSKYKMTIASKICKLLNVHLAGTYNYSGDWMLHMISFSF